MDPTLDNISQMFFEHSRKIAAAISIILIILMSMTVANSVLIVLDAAHPPHIASDPSESNKFKEKKYYKVSDLELFGKVTEVRISQQVRNAPKTNLNLELQGIFIAENKERSTAIVGEANKTGRLFEIGDPLPGNATLVAVFVDHILLRRGSRTEKLMFANNNYGIKKTETKNRAIKGRGPDVSFQGRRNLEHITSEIRGTTVPNLAPPAQSLNSGMTSYREKFRNDPAATLVEAGIRPVKTNETKGYRIGEDVQSQIRRVGLQPGDIVLTVNGRQIGAATNDSAIIDQVMASSRVRVEVQRGERRFFLTVPVPK